MVKEGGIFPQRCADAGVSALAVVMWGWLGDLDGPLAACVCG
jgi:hypothetical protein